jgi:hypothetical protein
MAPAAAASATATCCRDNGVGFLVPCGASKDEVRNRRAGHAFGDYLGNGSVRQALEFAAGRYPPRWGCHPKQARGGALTRCASSRVNMEVGG